MKTASFFTYQGPGRVSIARFAPRGTPKGFRVYKRLAPGDWFNRVSYGEYVELFEREILAPLDPARVVQELEVLAAGAEPVLLCWERPNVVGPKFDETNYCHRRLVADWLQRTLKMDVAELDAQVTEKPAAPAEEV